VAIRFPRGDLRRSNRFSVFGFGIQNMDRTNIAQLRSLIWRVAVSTFLLLGYQSPVPNGTVVSKLLRLSGLCKELLNAVGGQRVRTMLFCWDDDDWCLRDAGAQLEHESPQAICCQAEMS